jgi:hypothetical protein
MRPVPAEDPMAVFLEPLLIELSARDPNAVLLLPVTLVKSDSYPLAVLLFPVVLEKRASYPRAVSSWQLVQLASALVPAAVLKLGLALLTTGSVPGVAPLAAQVCGVKTPVEQDVTEPMRLKPELHANEQLPPEARMDEQLPRLPFAGADTAHGLAAHDCVAVKTPLALQVVAEPTRP